MHTLAPLVSEITDCLSFRICAEQLRPSIRPHCVHQKPHTSTKIIVQRS